MLLMNFIIRRPIDVESWDGRPLDYVRLKKEPSWVERMKGKMTKRQRRK